MTVNETDFFLIEDHHLPPEGETDFTIVCSKRDKTAFTYYNEFVKGLYSTVPVDQSSVDQSSVDRLVTLKLRYAAPHTTPARLLYAKCCDGNAIAMTFRLMTGPVKPISIAIAAGDNNVPRTRTLPTSEDKVSSADKDLATWVKTTCKVEKLADVSTEYTKTKTAVALKSTVTVTTTAQCTIVKKDDHISITFDFTDRLAIGKPQKIEEKEDEIIALTAVYSDDLQTNLKNTIGFADEEKANETLPRLVLLEVESSLFVAWITLIEITKQGDTNLVEISYVRPASNLIQEDQLRAEKKNKWLVRNTDIAKKIFSLLKQLGNAGQPRQHAGLTGLIVISG